MAQQGDQGGSRPKKRTRQDEDDERRVAACRNWKIQSPQFDRNAAIGDPKTKSWEGTLTLSMPKSWAWVEERFPGCTVSPLFAADWRRARTKVTKLRSKKEALGGKDFYVPDDDGIGSNS